MGVPITTEMIGDGGEIGYRVKPDDYYLPDLDLDRRRDRGAAGRGERDLARQPAGEGALMKLGGSAIGRGHADRVAAARAGARGPVRGVPRAAPSSRSPTAANPRTVEPWGLSSKRGHWYVVGFDRDRDAIRAFRADRIDGDVEVGEPDAFARPGRLPPRRPHRGPPVDAR